jgi:hypothetical protein
VTKTRAGRLWGKSSPPRRAPEKGGNTPRPPLAPAAPKGGDLSVTPLPVGSPLIPPCQVPSAEIKNGVKVPQARFDEAGQVAGTTRPLRSARTEKAPRGSSSERLSRGEIDSDAAWKAYALFAVQTGWPLPLLRGAVSGGAQWTLHLRRGLALSALPPCPDQLPRVGRVPDREGA